MAATASRPASVPRRSATRTRSCSRPRWAAPVATALDALGADLLERCLGRDEAAALLRSTLEGLGVAEPKVEVGGIRAIPIEGGDAYVQHVADGCVVYGGAQFDQAGRYTWYLSSR